MFTKRDDLTIKTKGIGDKEVIVNYCKIRELFQITITNGETEEFIVLPKGSNFLDLIENLVLDINIPELL